MEVVRYEVTYWEDNDIQHEKGWAFGESVADAVNQILGWYDDDKVDTINIYRMEKRDHAVLPDWESQDIMLAEENDTKN